MERIINLLKTLNALSKEILSGLNSETVSLESVEKKNG